jgi:hypothetical protein
MSQVRRIAPPLTASLRTSAIVEAIAATRATSLADFRVKARALLWCYSGDYKELTEELFDEPTYGGATTDVRLIHSIIADLLVGEDKEGV